MVKREKWWKHLFLIRLVCPMWWSNVDSLQAWSVSFSKILLVYFGSTKFCLFFYMYFQVVLFLYSKVPCDAGPLLRGGFLQVFWSVIVVYGIRKVWDVKIQTNKVGHCAKINFKSMHVSPQRGSWQITHISASDIIWFVFYKKNSSFSTMYASYSQFAAAHIMNTLRLYMTEQSYQQFVEIMIAWKQGVICGPVAEYMLLDLVSKLELNTIKEDLEQFFEHCPTR